MRKLLLPIVAALCMNGTIYAQETSQGELDLLKLPSSPGFILLDKEATDIERPTTPTDFMVSLHTATGDFSGLPKNYAIELAPFWLFGSKKISYDNLIDTTFNFKNNFKQSLTLSIAISSSDENSNNTQLGFGAKFSILRGNHISTEFMKASKQASTILSQVNDLVSLDVGRRKITEHYRELINAPGISDDSIVSLSRSLEKALKDYESNYPVALNNALLAKEQDLKKLSETKLQRYGWMLDAAGGIVTDFQEMTFDSATVPKYGAWLTLTHEGKKGFTFLVVARELFQMNAEYTAKDESIQVSDLNHTDAGLKLILDQNKFTFSLEGLTRFTGGTNDIKNENKSAWKAMLNTSYDLGNNKIITFNIGRDFNGTVTKGGNLIVALNLVLGFGDKRNLQ